MEGDESEKGLRFQVLAGVGPTTASQMVDSRELFLARDGEGLRQRLSSDGYLLLTKLISPSKVFSAHEKVLNVLANHGAIYRYPNGSLSNCYRKGETELPSVSLLSMPHVAEHRLIKGVVEGKELRSLMKMLFQEEPITTSYKWLRGVRKHQFTGVHMDRVYLQESPILTAWVPLGDVPPSMGSMMVIPRSHTSAAYEVLRNSYGRSSVGRDGTNSGWFSDDGRDPIDAYGGNWLTHSFKPGDVCIFGVDVVHMTAANCTDCLRISCDTRWKPKSAEHTNPALSWRELRM